jgi:hypothetical protein
MIRAPTALTNRTNANHNKQTLNSHSIHPTQPKGQADMAP